MEDIKIFDRIISDLKKEKVRANYDEVVQELNGQIEALKSFKKEVIDFRTLKSILSNTNN